MRRGGSFLIPLSFEMFSTQGMLLKAGPCQWILQEAKEIDEMNFRFIDKIDASSYVTRLANSMQISSPEHIVSDLDTASVVV